MKIAMVLAVVVLGCFGCGDDGDEATGVFGEVMRRGSLRVATDPAYPPQSSRDGDGVWTGFDVDTARGIASELNVIAEFVTPDFADVVRGNWDGAWDISVGSVAITSERQANLKFSDPYYYIPAYYAVKPGSSISTIADLNGKTICVADGTTYLSFVSGSLSIPADNIYVAPPTGATIVLVASDAECGPRVDSGEVDAMLTSDTTIQGVIADGIALTEISEAVFAEADATAFDRDQRTDNDSLIAAVNRALEALRDSGRLAAYSQANFGFDATNPPSN
jgi:polar amino acid transport system substrate-binding protein